MRSIAATAIIAAASLILSSQAFAQVYKCKVNGKSVFSDVPCADDAKKVHVFKDAAPSSGGGTGSLGTGAEACKEAFAKEIGWDPERTKENWQVSGGKMELIEYADAKLSARRFAMVARTRNSDTGVLMSVGSTVCYTSPDGRRVLKLGR